MIAEKKNILVVDDEEITVSLLAMFFQKYPCGVSRAANGEEAIKLLEKTVFDLVITDLQMGETNGLEVIRRTKKLSPSTLVFLMTACTKVEYAIAAFLNGADDFLLKPFPMTTLLARLRLKGFVLEQPPRDAPTTRTTSRMKDCQKNLQSVRDVLYT